MYSGISSGSVVATLLANKVPLEEVVKSTLGQSKILPPLNRKTIYDFSAKDMIQRVTKEALSWKITDPLKIIQQFFRLIPTGLFKGNKSKHYLESVLEAYGGVNDFRKLACELYLGATDQDSFKHTVFGLPETNQTPISDAVRASCALVPLFTPWSINDRKYIDGQITHNCHLELLVKRGCRLIVIIDPLVPYKSYSPGVVDKMGGLFTMVESIKTLVHTRFTAQLRHLTERYPDVDFVIFQPYGECLDIMAGSPMGYSINTKITQVAYQHTMRQLIERFEVYGAKFAKYNLHLNPPSQLKELERNGFEI